MAIEIYTAKELRRRTLNRIDGLPANGGSEHLQIGTATLELEAAHVEQYDLQAALNRLIRGYVKQYNRDKPKNKMIGARVVGVEIVRLYE